MSEARHSLKVWPVNVIYSGYGKGNTHIKDGVRKKNSMCKKTSMFKTVSSIQQKQASYQKIEGREFSTWMTILEQLKFAAITDILCWGI